MYVLQRVGSVYILFYFYYVRNISKKIIGKVSRLHVLRTSMPTVFLVSQLPCQKDLDFDITAQLDIYRRFLDALSFFWCSVASRFLFAVMRDTFAYLDFGSGFEGSMRRSTSSNTKAPTNS